MNYPPAINLTPTTETNTFQGIINSTLKGLQKSAHFPELVHHLKTKLDTYEEKLHVVDPHITITPLTCNLGQMETSDLYDTPNISIGTISSESSYQEGY